MDSKLLLFRKNSCLEKRHNDKKCQNATIYNMDDKYNYTSIHLCIVFSPSVVL